MNHETHRPPETDPDRIDQMDQINAAWNAYQQLAASVGIPTDELLRFFRTEYIGTYADLAALHRALDATDERAWEDDFRIARDDRWLHLFGQVRAHFALDSSGEESFNQDGLS